ncbi:hypothetical protein PI125_g17301 [Phytophthora idaei]|nr:hypothetical protein PI125_g17301 [Phytophthora idaei]
MATLEYLDGLVDEEYLASVKEVNAIPAELAIYAASKMPGWNITLKTVDDASCLTSVFTYGVENATKTFVLVREGECFAVEVDGYLE